MGKGDEDAMSVLASLTVLPRKSWTGKGFPSGDETLEEAADLGSIQAHHELGRQYYTGDGVGRDKARGTRHWEQAAMKGHVLSRHSLGLVEAVNGNYSLALQHTT